MTKLSAIAPVLLVRSVVESANYFRDKVGFSFDRLWGDPPDFCMVTRDGCTIMLSQVATGTVITPNWKIVGKMWDAYLWVDDAKVIYEEMKGRGAIIDYTLGVKDYGCLEFGIQDLDDHDIAIGQVLT